MTQIPVLIVQVGPIADPGDIAVHRPDERCTAAKYSNPSARPQPRAIVDRRSSLGMQLRSWAAPMFCIQKVTGQHRLYT